MCLLPEEGDLQTADYPQELGIRILRQVKLTLLREHCCERVLLSYSKAIRL